MAITQRHIAAAANVSRSTVAAVMSQAQCGRISPEVRERVLAVAAQLGYRPNRYAQIMRNGRSRMIGIIDCEPLHQISQRKVVAAAKEILNVGYEPIAQEILWSAPEGHREDAGREACQRMLDSRVEGLVLVHPSRGLRPEHLDPLLQVGIPIVALGQMLEEKIPCFASDRSLGYAALANHLLEQGYRHIGVLAHTDAIAEIAVREAVERSGVAGVRITAYSPMQDDTPGTPDEELQFIRGLRGMRKLLSGRSRPEAVVCNNDEWALGALSACTEANLTVPGEIAITGHDNLPPARFGTVPITSIAQPISELAGAAVDVLVKALQRKKAPKPGVVRLPGELIIRRSSCQTAGREQGQGNPLATKA